MDIIPTTKGIADFLKANEGLIQKIDDYIKLPAGTAQDLENLFNELEDLRTGAARFAAAVSNSPIKFMISQKRDTRVSQQRYLDQIEQVSKDIQTFQDDPEIVAGLYANRAALFAALANTYDDTFSQNFSFTHDEIDALNVLLRRATLDATAREQAAQVLDASIQISKFALSMAAKVLA